MKNKSITLKFEGRTVNEILESGKLFDENAAAFCLDCSVAYLQRDRHINGTRPDIPYIKRGRSVRYEPGIIKQIIEKSRVGKLEFA